ncbi:MAG: DNA methyltransferase [archaeon]
MIPTNLSELVTFIPNKTIPIHNWFYYKEGFSRDFAKWAIKEFNLQEPILDPFCGSGTTLLAAKELGKQAMGFDVSPLAALASKVKTRNYDVEELESYYSEFREFPTNFEGTAPLDKRVRKLFYKPVLDEIWALKRQVEGIPAAKTRELFLLALIDTAGRVANVQKVGGSLRKQKKGVLPAKKLFLGKIRKMIIDLEKQNKNGIEPEVLEADARIAQLKPDSIGSVLTSPPYLNKIEYASVYKLELGMFFGCQGTRLRAYIADSGEEEKTVLPELEGMPSIVKAYFADLKLVLENLHMGTQNSAKVIFELAGGCFPDRNVESDELLARLAESAGFKHLQTIPCRQIPCHKFRSMKTGTVRESVVLLEKR